MTAKPANGHDRDHGERRPLLRTHSSDDASDPSSVQSAQVQEWTRNGMIVVAMCFMVAGLFPGVDALLDVGGLEILEGILCRRTHGDVPNPPTDPRCKDADVQGEFARLTALSFTLSFIPGLTAVTWGVVAEKYGRKPVLVLSLTSLFAMNAIDIVIFWFSDYISPYWKLATSFLNFFGGGATVFYAMAFTMVSEVIPESSRATVYLYLGVAPVLGVIVFSPVAYVCMNLGHWFTACMGLLGYVVTIIITCFIPETIKENKHAGEELHDVVTTNKGLGVKKSVVNAVVNTGESLRLVFFSDKKLGLLVLSALFADFGKSVFNLMMQYARKRLDFEWREANLLITGGTVSRLIICMILIPAISAIILKYNVNAMRKDMWVARFTIICGVAGYLGLGLSRNIATFIPSLVLYNANGAYMAALRSLLAKVAGDGKIAVVFSILGLLDSLSIVAGGPLMAHAYSIGLRLGNDWLGLPFFISACLLSAVAIIIWCVPMDYNEKGQGDEESTARDD